MNAQEKTNQKKAIVVNVTEKEAHEKESHELEPVPSHKKKRGKKRRKREEKQERGSKKRKAEEKNEGKEEVKEQDGKKKDETILWRYHPAVIDAQRSAQIHDELCNMVQKVPQKPVRLYGKWVNQPRLVMYCAAPEADKEKSYSYSGAQQESQGWPTVLQDLLQQVQQILPAGAPVPNTALVNVYRTGQDNVGWHSDKDGREGPIVSFSFYPTNHKSRHFDIRKKSARQTKIRFLLEQGSAFVMFPGMQEAYEHTLPKMTKLKTSRVNVTFRWHP